MPKTGRKPLIKGTEWQDLIDQMIAAGWSSASIAMFLSARYGYDLEPSTIRRYRSEHRSKIEDAYPELVAGSGQRTYTLEHVRKDELIDTIGELSELIRLQRERLEIGLSMEQQAGLMLPDLRHELKTLADMLKQYHELLQDWGVVPKPGVDVNVRLAGIASADPVTIDVPALEAFPHESHADVLELARRIHEVAPDGVSS